jgi:methylenetetrahydrofolate dehydrogenase (NADP+) / methenyltetrahydrofolate cyclohydrolase
METKVLKGESVRDRILAETKSGIAALAIRFGKKPGIAFIGFEGVPLARYTIPLHVNMAEDLGFMVSLKMMPEDTTEGELFVLIHELNEDPEIHAVVVLQPVPSHLSAIRISGSIAREKEVEGFNPYNMLGTVLPDVIENRYPMCLPAALGEIFRDAGIIPGIEQEWVFLVDEEFLHNPLTRMIVYTSSLKVVPPGSPVTFLTPDAVLLIDHCKKADYLVIVTKHPEYVQPAWLKEGVCIIDIYSNLVKEIPSKDDPMKMIPVIRGGITVKAVDTIAGAILPIPGGLMTTVLALLFRNAMMAFNACMEGERRIKVN